LSAPARRSEIAEILAAGIVRMNSRVTMQESKNVEFPAELPESCLELSSENVLSVTNVVNDQ
jgi:hypothetical protein